MEKKGTNLWSHPEFYFGIAGLVAFFAMPNLIIAASKGIRGSVSGLDVALGNIEIFSPTPGLLKYYPSVKTEVFNPALLLLMFLIPVLSLSLILICRSDNQNLKRAVSAGLFLVASGFLIYLRSDFLSFEEIKAAPMFEDIPISSSGLYKYDPQTMVGVGLYFTLFAALLSFFSPSIVKFLSVPAESKPVVLVDANENPENDPFWDGK